MRPRNPPPSIAVGGPKPQELIGGDTGLSTDDRPAFRGRYPTPLAFGTSGLRGLVSDITDLEAYINTRGFLDYLGEIGVQPGDPISIAGDLRPSTNGPDRSI